MVVSLFQLLLHVKRKLVLSNIIKIDEMIDLDLDILGYIDSNITLNFVREKKLEKKEHLELPLTLTNVISCKNPRCISCKPNL